ncbi:uncharacterized protein PFL1_02011 [Pseudozyma flocculosa PF-1]|uniref:Related to RRP7 - essential protein involved in rRNA processing and ribosome biogenesis n=1 Tax=Pseudozyma flocculosa TaxID=84751 RepID=A0A5C3F2B0_9BASI|nr:uncharacterized protein PFL1_02011 [Pseudozyma flocculosa PF-1]EPQ30485.1 hypothetical protein PFL1_02011 [Pseudozyma flocculosa PF-1]SPO37569.1 related to RRP7 - essential protein involved in rRNA processing and ribosome biogenesis [Pseudozyma flocculosa]
MGKRKQQSASQAVAEGSASQAGTPVTATGTKNKKQRRASEASVASPTKALGATATASAAQQVASGFYAVPITLPSTSIQPPPVHYLYCRAHATSTSSRSANNEGDDDEDDGSGAGKKKRKEDLLPAGRTLFCVNLPVDSTEKHLRALFKKAGTIHSVVFQQLRGVPGFYAGAQEEEQEVEEDEEDAEDDGEAQANPAGPAKGKGKGKKAKKPKGPPPVAELPALDPRIARGSEPLLTTASSAYVVFLDDSSLERALEQIRSGQVRSWPDPFKSLAEAARHAADNEDAPNDVKNRHAKTADQFAVEKGAADRIPPLGLQLLLEQHRCARPPMEAVKAYADSTIARFAWIKAHPAPRKVGVKGVTVGPDGELLDEDGFTIVQRGAKTGGGYGFAEGGLGTVKASRVRLGRERESDSRNNNTKNKSKDLENFYRFQVREKKREKLADLRAQFEADKAKVAKLKASRRFNPY